MAGWASSRDTACLQEHAHPFRQRAAFRSLTPTRTPSSHRMPCRALQQNGVPKVTTCAVKFALSGTVPKFTAALYQGSVSNPNVLQELHTAWSDTFTPQE